MTENLCVSKRHCAAACCRNTRLGLTKEEFRKFFKEFEPRRVSIQELHGISLMAQALACIENELYYANLPSGFVSLQLVGPCPYLDEKTNNCSTHEHGQYPEACEKLQPGEDECNKLRSETQTPTSRRRSYYPLLINVANLIYYSNFLRFGSVNKNCFFVHLQPVLSSRF